MQYIGRDRTQEKYGTYTHVIEDNLMTAVSAGCQPVDAFK